MRRFDSSHEALDAGPVVGLAFNHGDQELLYYAKAQTIFGSSQSLMRSHNCPHENEYIVSFDKLLNLRFAVGIPFYGVHGVGPEWTVNEWEYICRRIYLSFGMATHRTEGWTVACILKSVGRCETTTNCDYVLDLADGLQRADWMLVARLWGFQRPTNSIGCVVAASKRGSRLAVANWNVLYVWALDMSALTATYPSEFYPPWSWRDTPKAVDLGPVVIQLHAVCFQLRFLEGENELMAITDRGVMHWDLSPLGKGERRYHEVQVIPH